MVDIVSEYESAVKAKQTIEEEIEGYVAELTSGTNPGLKGPLVDAEGFPRADIDVYRVRQLRHSLAMKQTDHLLIMKKIEELLPQVFEARSGQSKSKTSTDLTSKAPQAAKAVAIQSNEVKAEERELQPFAVVESVQSESPAETAGLLAQDQVLLFGSANASNHRELAAIKDIVQHNIGNSIRVLVRRATQLLALELTPQTWKGPGVLGCLLVPV